MIKKILISLLLLSSYLTALTEEEKPYRFYFELGVTFGGDTIAANNNGGKGGDDYRAGGGAVLGLGTIINIKEAYKYQARVLAAYRYQGGDGSNKGIVLEGGFFYRAIPSISVGAGLHADFANEVKTDSGETIKLDSSIAPMLTLEWSTIPELVIGAKYIHAEYESSTRTYDGNQGAVYFQKRF